MKIDFSNLNKVDNTLQSNKIKHLNWQKWFTQTEIKVNHVNDKRVYYREDYLKSDHWKNLRMNKIISQNSCEHCQTKTTLDVHHLNYKNLFDVELHDLQVLCRACHIKEHVEEVKVPESKYIFTRTDCGPDFINLPDKPTEYKKSSSMSEEEFNIWLNTKHFLSDNQKKIIQNLSSIRFRKIRSMLRRPIENYKLDDMKFTGKEIQNISKMIMLFDYRDS